ncbi:hypothetical protein GJAV_G00121060 [Gymnothorax javanicus]|nr:hypothetical protein GJAV_G00121060 [Gymnothorax javanicus]
MFDTGMKKYVYPPANHSVSEPRVIMMQRAAPLLRSVSSWILSRAPAVCRAPVGAGLLQGLPWPQQLARGVTRGNEYQPKNIKRTNKHGWQKRLSTRGGIELILRRMVKGRKSLTVCGGRLRDAYIRGH